MTNLLMLDSIEVGQFAGLKFDALAGYVPPSSWPDYALECVDYPELSKLHRIESITPTAHDDASIIDCENGDATPGEVPGWVDRQIARGVWRPGVYASLATWNGGLLNALAHYGNKIRRWVADWTFVEALSVAWADAQQFTDRYAKRNIDGSVCRPDFFPSAPQPTPKNDLHLGWFDQTPRHTPHGKISEYDLVRRYDGAREHPDKDKHLLAALESQCHWLARRVEFVARYMQPLGHPADWGMGSPSWAVDHRGWRRIQLARRAQGQRFI